MGRWGERGTGKEGTYVISTLILLAFDIPSSKEEWCHLSRHVRMFTEVLNSTNAHPRHFVGSSRLLRHRTDAGFRGAK